MICNTPNSESFFFQLVPGKMGSIFFFFFLKGGGQSADMTKTALKKSLYCAISIASLHTWTLIFLSWDYSFSLCPSQELLSHDLPPSPQAHSGPLAIKEYSNLGTTLTKYNEMKSWGTNQGAVSGPCCQVQIAILNLEWKGHKGALLMKLCTITNAHNTPLPPNAPHQNCRLESS